MFDSRQKALSFRDEIVRELDAVETDGFHVSATLEGAEVRLGSGVARVRGHLDGQGYRVDEKPTDEAEGWAGALDVRP